MDAGVWLNNICSVHISAPGGGPRSELAHPLQTQTNTHSVSILSSEVLSLFMTSIGNKRKRPHIKFRRDPGNRKRSCENEREKERKGREKLDRFLFESNFPFWYTQHTHTHIASKGKCEGRLVQKKKHDRQYIDHILGYLLCPPIIGHKQ